MYAPNYTHRHELEIPGSRLINAAGYVHPPVVAVSVANQAVLSGLAQTIDDVPLNTPGMRVLLANQTNQAQNGIWVVQSGAWTRPTDWASSSARRVGEIVIVESGGSTNFPRFGHVWMVTTGGVVDTDGIRLFPAQDKGSGLLNLDLIDRWILAGAQATANDSQAGAAAAVNVELVIPGAGNGELKINGTAGHSVRFVISNF
jgi:hypothetical protein